MAVLILFKGHPATGKSAVAYNLARHLGFPLIDKDDIKDHTAGFPNGNDLAYSIMWQVVGRQLSLGMSTIVDSPLSHPEAYTTGCQLAKIHATTLLVIETHVDDRVWQQRLEQRKNQDSSHKISSWLDMQQLLVRYNGCWQYPIDPAHHMIVDTITPVDELVAGIVAKLKDRL